MSEKKEEDIFKILVNIWVTFVATKAGVDPKLRIDNPTNLIYELATIDLMITMFC